MTTRTQQIRIEEFDYPLLDERIAKFPLDKRDESKLLLYKDGKVITDVHNLNKEDKLNIRVYNGEVNVLLSQTH